MRQQQKHLSSNKKPLGVLWQFVVSLSLLFFGSIWLFAQEAYVEIDVTEAPEIPLYYSVVAKQDAKIEVEQLSHRAILSFKVIQGEPERLSVGMVGVGEVTSVKFIQGEDLELLGWGVRQVGEERFLDLEVSGTGVDLQVEVHATQEWETLPAKIDLWGLSKGKAKGFVGFKNTVKLDVPKGFTVGIEELKKATPVRKDNEKSGWEYLLGAGPVNRRLVTTEGAEVQLQVARTGLASGGYDLSKVSLQGVLDEEAEMASFVFKGELMVDAPNTKIALLSGAVAVIAAPSFGEASSSVTPEASEGETASSPSQEPSGEKKEERSQESGAPRFFVENGVYFLEAEEAGKVSFELNFDAQVRAGTKSSDLGFRVFATGPVPVLLEGWEEVAFDETAGLVPRKLESGDWQAYVPLSGRVGFRWFESQGEEESSLVYQSTGRLDVVVQAGVVRQTSQVSLEILQGEMSEVFLEVSGEGEVFEVVGDGVMNWEREEGGIKVTFSQPQDEFTVLKVVSELSFDSLPRELDVLGVTPKESTSYYGLLRLRNAGSVKLNLLSGEGLIQQAADVFGSALQKLDSVAESGQSLVYSFPASGYTCRLLATPREAEVTIREMSLYHLGLSDSVIESELELEIRESELREWSIEVPSDYAVVSVTGSQVADSFVAPEADGEMRRVRVVFSQGVQGRQLIKLRLEKNAELAAGEWSLPRLGHPGAKTVLGDLGVVLAPGSRVSVGTVTGVAEKPLSVFPKSVEGLQLAFRVRQAEWEASLAVELLEESIEAEVFHSYSLKDGRVFGSILITYFVAGSPVDEFRVRFPEDALNVSVEGEGVRTWREENNEVIVTLQQPVMGLHQMLLTCEEEIGITGGVIRPGRFEPLGLQSERGYIQIVSPVQVKSEVTVATGGLLELESRELPADYQIQTFAPSVAAFQYTKRPFELEINVDWFAAGETTGQLIQFAEAKSKVSRDGEIVTEVFYQVKTREGRVLRMTLPNHARLWEVTVDGKTANVRKDGAETLIPVGNEGDANQVVEVKVRYGSQSEAAKPHLNLPAVAAPILMTEWLIEGDERRELVLREKGTDEFTNFLGAAQGLSLSTLYAGAGCGLFLFLVVLLGKRLPGAMLLLTILATLLTILAFPRNSVSWQNPEEGSKTLNVSVPVISAGEVVEVDVVSREKQVVGLGLLPLLLVGIGALWATIGALRLKGGHVFIGVLLFGIGCLISRDAGYLLFLMILAGYAAICIRLFFRVARGSGKEQLNSGVATSVLIGSLFAFTLLGGAPAAEAKVLTSANSLSQAWEVDEDLVQAEAEVTIEGEVGDRFRLLTQEVILHSFGGEGMRVETTGNGYWVVLTEGEDSRVASFSYELPRTDAMIKLPTMEAAVNTLSVSFQEGNWQVWSPQAASKKEADSGKKVTLNFMARKEIQVAIQPASRDVFAEETRFRARVENAYWPGTLVESMHRVVIEPTQGVVREVTLSLPAGLVVRSVDGVEVAEWRYLASEQQVVVELLEPQYKDFSLMVMTRGSFGQLPLTLALSPVRVVDSEQDGGILAILSRGTAQAEEASAEGLLLLNAGDWKPTFLPEGRDGPIERVYRYGEEEASLELEVTTMKPEVRLESEQVLSLGSERTLLKVGAQVAVTRAGVFSLSFAVPEGYEVESLSCQGMSHWDEAEVEGRPLVTIHFAEKFIGSRKLDLVLSKLGALFASDQPEDEESLFEVPRFLMEEASRQSGLLTVSAEQGLRLRTVSRQNVSEIDSGKKSNFSENGGLAFRLLQKDWNLSLALEALDPWLTGQNLQEVTLREGQTKTAVNLDLLVEHSSVRSILVKLPPLSDAEARTLRASGEVVNGLAPVEGQEGLWEIKFKRRVIGKNQLRLEWERTGERSEQGEGLSLVSFPGFRQTRSYLALRASTHLEVTTDTLPQGWQRLDWSAVPGELRAHSLEGVPAMVMRVSEGEIDVNVTRHALAETLNLRVTKGVFTSVISQQGGILTRAVLTLNVNQRSTLRVTLPESASLLNVLINDRFIDVVRDGKDYLFYVLPLGDQNSANVELNYLTNRAEEGQATENLDLVLPELSAPLENIEWEVFAPEGYQLGRFKGDLDLEESGGWTSFKKADYDKSLAAESKSQKEKALSVTQMAEQFMQDGKRDAALELYRNNAGNPTLDAAANEDARVKLQQSQIDQVIVGMSTNRQRVYLGNSWNDFAGQRDEQLEQAAGGNLILQGETNFRPEAVQDNLKGNSVEVNSFLRRIAPIMVRHHSASESVPQSITFTVPTEGEKFVFRRSLQVQESGALTLNASLTDKNAINTTSLVINLALIVVFAILFALIFNRKSSSAAKSASDALDEDEVTEMSEEFEEDETSEDE